MDPPWKIRPALYCCREATPSKSIVPLLCTSFIRDQADSRPLRYARSVHQCRSTSEQNVPEGLPKAENPVVGRHMPAERAMTLIGVAIEADVLRQEVPEGAERCIVPVPKGQHRLEHALEPAILITGDAERTGEGVGRSGHRKVGCAHRLEVNRPFDRDG